MSTPSDSTTMSTAPTIPTDNAANFKPMGDDVFGRIASRYDLLCDVFSLGIHRIWKNKVARVIAQEEWATLLDGATGTGDIIVRVLAYQSHLQQSADRTIIASDISPPMLAIAQRRLGVHAQRGDGAHAQRGDGAHAQRVRLENLNAEAMPSIASASVDAYSISLCLKICNRQLALQEALRVLKPGGRIIVLEASNIRWRWLHSTYLAYMSVCMPLIGYLATGGDASAYKYLLAGVKEFPTAEALAAEMAASGFADVKFERLSLGIMAIHIARKPHAL